MLNPTQNRYMITDGSRLAVVSTGTIHLSAVSNWVDVKVFKEYNAAKRCIENNKAVLGGCHVARVEIVYKVEQDRSTE